MSLLILYSIGFKKIENLDEYTGLKVLYLEGNGLSKIEGLSKCVELRALYLQENLIENIDGLESLAVLDSINLSNNLIESLDGIEKCPSLSSLVIPRNRLKDISSLQTLSSLPKLTVLDVSHNHLTGDGEEMIKLLSTLPALRVLYLKGNPVVDNIQNYRKAIITTCKELTYLDERPVFPEERRLAEAWARGTLFLIHVGLHSLFSGFSRFFWHLMSYMGHYDASAFVP